ncbi:uncharacterized protein LOC141618923 [Silene latifolia]|uniref:uncharacterized protein LOC141618923 n=1 Tax=Silene latifolia TaxID=37657 RepID=UPI003D7770C1
MSNIRGQGYDGASKMSGELNGLQSLIMRDNPCAYYVHCFAHQFQLTLVAVAKENKDSAKFFQHLGIVLNNIGYSCKRLEMVRDIQADKILEALASCESGSDSRFDVKSMEMLICIACFSPSDVFAYFDKEKLVTLVKFYPNEFNDTKITLFEFELDIFESDMLRDSRFHLIKSLAKLSIMLVETKKHIAYPRVYLLLKLVLKLPVAMTSVERVFSS